MQKSIILFFVFAILSGIAMGQVPQLINYQGVLVDPATRQPVDDDNYEIVFSVYDVASGGSPIWTGTKNVHTQNGLYSVLLGSPTSPLIPAMFKGPEKYLGIKVGDDPEMTPRKRIVSVAYAIVSATADSLGDKAAEEYTIKTELSISDGNPPNQGSNQVNWDNLHEVPDGFADGIDDTGGGGGNTLDQAYDQGGPGAGRTINADAGAFEVSGKDGILFSGTFGSGSIPKEGTGTRLMWYPSKAAFRAGRVYEDGGTFWDAANIGNSSVAMGSNTRAGGEASMAIGVGTNASNDVSTALGYETEASGLVSTAMGYNTRSSGEASVATGIHTNASGNASIAMGSYTAATGDYSLAAGYLAKAKHRGSFVWSDASGTSSADSFVSTARNQFIIRATGGVGIGTNNPAEALDVDGTVQMIGIKMPTDASSGYVLTSDASGVGTWQPTSTGGGNTLNQAYNQGGPGVGRTITANAGAVNIEGPGGLSVNGWVGIGTTTPEHPLHVKGFFKLEGADFRMAEPSAGDGGRVLVHWGDGSGTNDQIILNFAGDFEEGIKVNGSKFVVDGKLGIGTTTPEHPLHVKGFFKLEGTDFLMADPSRGDGGRALVHWGNGSGIDDQMILNFDGDFEEGVNLQGSKLIVDGQVGIGIADPIYKLEVSDDWSSNINPVMNIERTGAGSATPLRFTGPTGDYYNIGITQDSYFSISSLNQNIGIHSDILTINSGKVGIGTLPRHSTQLQVATDRRYAGYFSSDSVSSETHVIHAEFTGTDPCDAIGVYGRSEPAPWFGFGGYFRGGYRGVVSTAERVGAGSRYGVDALGANGNGANVGISAIGLGGSTAYGVLGGASGASTNNYAVYAGGDLAYTGSLIHVTDEKLIEDAQPLTDGLATVMKLKGKSYKFTKNSQYEHMNLPGGTTYGFIAQEVEKVLPELVSDNSHPSAAVSRGEKSNDLPIAYKGIDYIELIPILVEAIKEQQALINKQQKEISTLQNQLTQILIK